MRDRFLVRDDGTQVPVAELPTITILQLLKDGFICLDDETPSNIAERLRIELLARQMGL